MVQSFLYGERLIILRKGEKMENTFSWKHWFKFYASIKERYRCKVITVLSEWRPFWIICIKCARCTWPKYGEIRQRLEFRRVGLNLTYKACLDSWIRLRCPYELIWHFSKGPWKPSYSVNFEDSSKSFSLALKHSDSPPKLSFFFIIERMGSLLLQNQHLNFIPCRYVPQNYPNLFNTWEALWEDLRGCL